MEPASGEHRAQVGRQSHRTGQVVVAAGHSQSTTLLTHLNTFRIIYHNKAGVKSGLSSVSMSGSVMRSVVTSLLVRLVGREGGQASSEQ